MNPRAAVDPADIGPELTFARIDAGTPAWVRRLRTARREVELGEVAAVYYRRPTPGVDRPRHQIDPDGPWFRVPLDVQREVWPTEEYELARSLVDTSLAEDDLFASVGADITV